ncbi:hypothetical protein KC343_g9086 [Hortaea werneckii]|nr:hypothetical protein KC352_g23203 [Hortaea werneckii]KAI7555746.1 hypothetical protein KC317_g12743 [Hortaea werneckii]KAI7601492.1 hypothetical protein KC346_g12780 [Hortaea werneckii]KAI7618455.1 hypothetical protein KC343_g9086 [Hortaea werneckii]KAI7673575.1 hypothetical protein KC319_g5004 [Hortaea werneckii]
MGGIFRLPRLRAFAFEATAYGAVIFSLYGISTSRSNENNILTFLDGQGIEVPSRKFIDRLGKVDKDDAVVWGAIGGLFAAHRFRTWSISGWKRHVGAAVFGAALVRFPITLVDVAAAQVQDSDHAKTLIKRELYKMGWKAAVTRTLFDQSEQDLRARGLDIPVVAQSDPATLLAENGHDDGKKVLMAQIGERAIENDLMLGAKEVRVLLLKGEVLDQALTGTPPPSSYIRYLMSLLGSDAREKLEKHVSTITQKREQAASEAEQVWHYLTSKEAEYLDATSSSETEARPALRRYLEVLDVIHWALWSHASKRDWMIIHLQQCKQQLKTHPQESRHPGTTSPASTKPSQNATSTKFFFTNVILDRLSQRTEERKTNLQQSKRLLETVLSQLPIKPDKSHSSLGRPVPTRVGYQHAIAKLEKEIDAVEFDTKVIKQLIDDVELGWK